MRLDQLGGRGRQLRHQLDDLAGQLLEVDAQGLDLDVLRRGLVLHGVHAGLEVGGLLHQIHDAEARQALDDERVVVLAHLQELHDAGDGAHRVEVGRARILFLGPALGDHADHLVVTHRVLDERDRLLAAHRERKHAAREEHRVAQGEDRKDLRNVLLVDHPRGCHGGRHGCCGSALLLLVGHVVDASVSSPVGQRPGWLNYFVVDLL